MNLRPSRSSSGNFILSPIKEMELAASKIPGVVSLAQGIPSFSTPKVIKDFVHEKIDAGLCDRYSLTIGLAELREEIALALQAENLSYDPDREILVTAGSIEGITAALMACTASASASQNEVLVPSPTYASYAGSIYMSGCSPRYMELDEDNNFDFDISSIEKNITKKTRAILYCSPNNPTGTLYSKEKTHELLRVAEQYDIKIIIDEVYKDFYYTDDPHFTPASIPEARERIIRVCSFSKAYAMTGWRIGFLHTDAANMKEIIKYHDAMVTCAPVVSQYAAIAALRFGADALSDFQKEFRKRRDYIINWLDQLSDVLDYQVPKATYFVFPRIKDTVPLAHDSRSLAYDILKKAKVALVPGVAFGPSGESHLRISYGREPEALREGMQRLADYFSAAGSRVRIRKVPSAKNLDEPQKSYARPPALRAANFFLKSCAKLYLKRTRPFIIGIAGTKGKTVFKRALTEALSPHLRTRSSILSYNTESGLPLSILNLKSPRTFTEKMTFLLKAPATALFSGEKTELLILEYGVSSKQDAEELLKIARPDMLVVSSLSTPDIGCNYDSVLDGITLLAHQLSKEEVLWPADEPDVDRARVHLQGCKEMLLSALGESSLVHDAVTYSLKKDYVSQSDKLAVIASVMIASQLKVPYTAIENYLAKQ